MPAIAPRPYKGGGPACAGWHLGILLLMLALAGCSHGPAAGSAAAADAAGGVAKGSTTGVPTGGAGGEPLLAGRWLAGGNYTVLSPAQPDDVPPGKVQVTEVFWYGCPHCNAFEPYLNRWLASKPADVLFRRVPVMWGDIHQQHARLFYTLQVLGKLDALHDKVFAEIHQHDDLLYVQGNPAATFAAQLRFAEANGIGATDFTRAWHSAAVDADLQRAATLDERWKVDSVPTMVVDGRYKSDPSLAGTEENLLALVNDLIASERKSGSSLHPWAERLRGARLRNH